MHASIDKKFFVLTQLSVIFSTLGGVSTSGGQFLLFRVSRLVIAIATLQKLNATAILRWCEEMLAAVDGRSTVEIVVAFLSKDLNAVNREGFVVSAKRSTSRATKV
jgi:hypothetical protein